MCLALVKVFANFHDSINEFLVYFLKYYDVNDLGLSDYEDELEKLRNTTTEDHDYEQHPLSDLKLLQLVQA